MGQDDLHERLSRISTVWTLLNQAHAGQAEAAACAQQVLLQRYGGAIYRYILSAVRDPAAAEDLTQEFALGLIRGQFRRADPERGRFRDYVKTVLFHMVSAYRRRQQKHPRPVSAESPELAGLAAPTEDMDEQFDATWRETLLARAWEALARARPTFHAVLRLRAAQPDMTSAEMAQRLSQQLGKPCTPDGVRQNLRRARDAFADLLVAEVAHSLQCPTAERIEDELADLNLLVYCRAALGHSGRGSSPAGPPGAGNPGGTGAA
jgi:RNA polymerase sigma-70 factor (ECF subfamily)